MTFIFLSFLSMGEGREEWKEGGEEGRGGKGGRKGGEIFKERFKDLEI